MQASTSTCSAPASIRRASLMDVLTDQRQRTGRHTGRGAPSRSLDSSPTTVSTDCTFPIGVAAPALPEDLKMIGRERLLSSTGLKHCSLCHLHALRFEFAVPLSQVDLAAGDEHGAVRS